jgi:hypothetical protein
LKKNLAELQAVTVELLRTLREKGFQVYSRDENWR